jgi:hypothetical protein
MTKTRDNFRDHFSLRLDAGTLLDPAVEPLIDWEMALRYLTSRRPASWPPGGLRSATASRTALWLAFVLQQATFQWVHQRLHHAVTPRRTAPAAGVNPYVQVPELVAGAPALPTPGADATTPDRRRYLAYWALVYLAHNVREKTWNAWVDAVPDPVIAAGTSISEYLLYHHNAAADALEPPGGLPRERGQRGNMVRFAVALDAYLRLNHGGAAEDKTDPSARAWPAVP